MSAHRHQDGLDASGPDAALPRPNLAKLIHGILLELVTQGTAAAPVIDVRLAWKGLA